MFKVPSILLANSSEFYKADGVYVGDDKMQVNMDVNSEMYALVKSGKSFGFKNGSKTAYEIVVSEINELSVSKDLDHLTINKFTNFVKALELNSFEVELDSTCATFNSNTVKGYISINPDHSFAYDLIFVDHSEHWNKISRCPLVFKIPKSRQGISSAILELQRLGNSKKELENDSYEPVHVNAHKWWST